jgi:hypothetical protein
MMLACTGICGDAIRLVIKQEPDPTGKYPESKLYIGVLVNDGTAPVSLKAVQLPGGYVGSGTLLNCSIEEWSLRNGSWAEVRTTDLKGFANPRIADVALQPHDERTVCRQMLPHEAGHAGSCVRFRLAESWASGSRRWTSTPFVIGEAPGARSCP